MPKALTKNRPSGGRNLTDTELDGALAVRRAEIGAGKRPGLPRAVKGKSKPVKMIPFAEAARVMHGAAWKTHIHLARLFEGLKQRGIDAKAYALPRILWGLIATGDLRSLRLLRFRRPMLPTLTTLFFAPTGQYVEAQIVELTADLAEQQIHRAWWADDGLLEQFDPPPIDRHWNWNEMAVEYDGKPLAAEKVALVTGNQAVQGAMMISAEPVPSILSAGTGALFVELLFTAPRNRPSLRSDGSAFFLGVGTELLTWGAWLSREMGYEGRLLLDGSPEYLAWYEKRGLQKLNAKPNVFEAVAYMPMELPVLAAQRLLKNW
jgi:hypothetical protein